MSAGRNAQEATGGLSTERTRTGGRSGETHAVTCSCNLGAPKFRSDCFPCGRSSHHQGHCLQNKPKEEGRSQEGDRQWPKGQTLRTQGSSFPPLSPRPIVHETDSLILHARQHAERITFLVTRVPELQVANLFCLSLGHPLRTKLLKGNSKPMCISAVPKDYWDLAEVFFQAGGTKVPSPPTV